MKDKEIEAIVKPIFAQMFNSNFSACEYGIECYKKGMEYQGIKELAIENDNLIKRVKQLEEKLANVDYQLEGRDNEIAELIQENEEMKKGLGCETCQIHLEYMKLNNKIANLEKENAELKSDSIEWEKASDKWKCVYELTNDQLTKAKKLIKDLLGSENTSCEEEMFFEIRQKAEQFIKKVEK